MAYQITRNDIRNPVFTFEKSGYSAKEVDEYVKKVTDAYINVVDQLAALSNQASKNRALAEEYLKRKTILAEIQLNAEADAREKKQKAETEYNKKIAEANQIKTEADTYYRDEIKKADNKSAEIYDRTVKDAGEKATRILEDATSKAEAIINAAENKAEEIKTDAKLYVSKCNGDIARIQRILMGFKENYSEWIRGMSNAVNSIETPQQIQTPSSEE